MYLCVKYIGSMNYSRPFKSMLVTMLFLITSVHYSFGQDYKSSVGGRLGTYVAASYTQFISEGRSFELLAGITRQANQSDFVFGGFYKLHRPASSQVPMLNWYLGGGIYISSIEDGESDKISLAPSAIIGLEYSLDHTPVNFFIDVSPYYDTGRSDSKLDMHANLGVRYVLSR